MKSNLSKLLNVYVTLLLSIVFILLNRSTQAQTYTCTVGTPTFAVHLENIPGGVWSSPNISRNGQCCGATSPDQCVFFDLYLNPNTVAMQIDMIGADPAGSLFYELRCDGNLIPGGSIKCIPQSYLSTSPLSIKFCKPGGNKNIYKITTISKPLFPADDTVRIGCKKKLISYGVVNNSVTWQAIATGTLATLYNSYLDSVNVASPTYSPKTGAPAYVDYKVCGFPIASACGFSITVCDTVRIYNYPSLTVSVTPNPATFCNVGPGSGVTLTGVAGGGLPAYSYSWQNSLGAELGTGSTYFATAQGAYKLEVKDRLYNAATCPSKILSPISVSVGLVPTVDAGPSQKVCATNPLAALSGSVQNAPGAIWSGGAGTFNPGNNYLNTNYMPTASEIAAGSLKLYLTSNISAGGCVNKKDSTYIYFSSVPSVTINTGTLSCNNSTTTIQAIVSGGTAPYTYLWNTSAITSSITGGQGNYSVIVKDSLHCASINTSKSIVAPTALALTFNSTNVVPDGSSTGTASVTVSGGTPTYSVNWTPGNLTTFSISSLPYGIYTAVITDANGCNISGSTVVGNSLCSGLTASATSTNVNCFGASTGKANVLASGGTPVYTYTWNSTPTQNTPTATNLKAGVYTVIVKDFNGCFQTANVTISEPTVLTNVMTHTDVTVQGGNNGSAAANPFGGTSPYTYLWNTSATTSSITNLFAGTYTVNVTDNKGCLKKDSVKIIQPPCTGLTLNVFTTNALCSGGKGSAFAIISGAKGTFTVTWSNGAIGQSVTNLTAGSYTVSVMDTANCSEFFDFTITEPSQLSLGIVSTNVSCNGLSNGTEDLTISGGTFPYTFNWNSGTSTSEDLKNLKPGTYSVQVTDANGCTSIASEIITEPAPLAVTSTSQNVTCINSTNGSISLNVSGGTIPYAYTWSTGATTSSITNLPAGGYTVTVKDANLCTIPNPLIIGISQPDSVKILTYTVSCSVPGTNQTQVTITPTGGYSGLFQVSYDNGSTYQTAGVYTAMLANATTYSIVLKDGNNCISLKPDVLTIKKEVKIDSVTFAKCYAVGTTTAPVTVYPSGGDNGPYTVSFDNGTSYLTAGTYSSNIAVAANYTVIIKDGRGCISAIKAIRLPAVLNATLSITSNYNGQNVSCFGLTDGSALATANGGTGAYTYSWSTVPSQTTATAANIGAGTYSVTINDVNNCAITNTVTLTQPTPVTVTAVVTSNYNGQNISCFGLSDGSASVTSSGGTSPYTYAWNTIPSQTTAIASTLSAGTYSVIVKDINNCAITKAVTLTQPASITSTVAVTSNYNGQQVTCFGATNASITATAANGTAPFTYTWSTAPVQTGTLAMGIGVGNYNVIITDANGCSITSTTSVSQPIAIAATTSITSNYNGQNISCFGLMDGSALATANGGTGAYTYSWSSVPSQTTAAVTNIGAGTYSVIVTDANGCNVTSTVNMAQPTIVDAQIFSVSSFNGYNVTCFGSTDGNIDITVNGGTGAYTYNWSTSATTQDILNIGAGSYSVVVTDINSCKDTLSTVLTQATKLIATIDSISNYNGYGVSCYGSQNGAIYVSVTGGVTNYTYAWSDNATTQDLTNVGIGSYSLIVNDNNACTASLSGIITGPVALIFSSVVTDPKCHGIPTGSVITTLVGGVSPYTYAWSNTATTKDLSNIGAGTYTVNYVDKNGCSNNAMIIVNQPDTMIISKLVDNLKCYGDTIGNIIFNAKGGTLPYTYLWSDGSTTKDLLNITSGTYSVVLTDANNCKYIDSTKITQPTALHIALSSPVLFNGYNVSSYQGNDGSVELTVSGGTTPYTYLWSNGSSTQNISNLSSGNYFVNMIDTNGCRISGEITLTQPLVLEMPQGFSPNEDGKNDLFVIHGIEAYPNNVLTIYNRWGNIVYSKTGYLNEWDGHNNNGDTLPNATYFAILEVNNGAIVLKGYVELRR